MEGCAKMSLPAGPFASELKRDDTTILAGEFRALIDRELARWGVVSPDGIGAALGMDTASACALLTKRRWRAGDLAALEAAASRLGLQRGADMER
jgi:hypothetical protein